MATTVKIPNQIKIEDIKITDWIDITSKEKRSYTPQTMTINAVINGIYTQNIMLPYMPITSKKEIIREIINVLNLDE